MRILCAILCLCVSAFAADRYVSTSGNDTTGTGTLGSPWRTIQKGVDNTFAGDTLHIRAGTYSERVNLRWSGTSASNRVTIRNYSNEVVIVDASSQLFWLSGNNATYQPYRFITVQGLIGRDADADGIQIFQAHFCTFTNLISSNNWGRGLALYNSNSNTWNGLETSFNSQEGHRKASGGLHLALSCSYNQFLNVTSRWNKCTGINLGGSGVKNSSSWPYYSGFNRYNSVTDSVTYGNEHQGINTHESQFTLIQRVHGYYNGATGIQVETGTWDFYILDCTWDSNNFKVSPDYHSECGIWIDEGADGLIQSNLVRGNYRPYYTSQSHSNLARFNRFIANNGQGWSNQAPFYTSAEILLGGLGMHVITNRTNFSATIATWTNLAQYSSNIMPAGGTHQGLVHNTIVGNGVGLGYDKGGWTTGSDNPWQTDPQGNDNVFTNNYVLNNLIIDTLGRHEGYDLDAQHDSIRWSDGNVFWNTNRAVRFRRGTSDLTLAGWQAASGLDAGSIEQDPLFTNPAGGDWTVQTNSPAVDRGVWLTTTTSSGSGTTIPVAYGFVFFPGNTYFGLQGDLIQLQGSAETVRVTGRTKTALTVDAPLTWTNGQGVAYAYAGTKPDSGYWELTDDIPEPPPPPDPPEISVRTSTASVSEVAGTLQFIFTRTGSTNAALSVNYTVSGTASNGVDYVTLTSPISMGAGITSASLTLTPIDDTAIEGSETVIITVAAGTGYVAASGATGSATATITDNEQPAENPLRSQPQPGQKSLANTLP